VDPAEAEAPAEEVLPEPEAGLPGSVSVELDEIAHPGSLVSGQVVFSDGMSAGWYLDQQGRLGLAVKQKGYKPTPEDVQQFQMLLQDKLAKLGF
jgi:hypothetical protein